jgi:hypothetical protein
MELAREFVDAMLQQVTNGEHAGELAAGVDNRQVADVALHHVDQGILLVTFVGDGLGGGSHDIAYASVLGMAMAEDDAEHHVPLREDAEQVAVIDYGDGAHPVLGHYFYGLQHTRVGGDGSRRNTGNLEETHRGLRAKRDLEVKLYRFRLTLKD